MRSLTVLTLLGLLAGASIARCDEIKKAETRPSPPRHVVEPPVKALLIVAPDRFYDALQPYARFKKQHIPTLLVRLEHVLRTTPGVDDPERLKRYVYTMWREFRVGYVLLVGDVDVMPVRYMVLDRNTPAAFDYAFYASDLYYADLTHADGRFDDWNARKEGFHGQYFGEVRGEHNKKDPINYDQVDYRPEVAVGRWPVDTLGTLQRVLVKSMAFEQAVRNRTHPGLRRLALFHPGGFVDERGRFDGVLQRLSRAWTKERFYYSDPQQESGTPPPDEDRFVEVLHRGVELAFHVGHGSPEEWCGCFSMPSLPKLKNADRVPLMFSCGCSTAAFAPEPPYGGYTDVHGREHRGTNNGEVFPSPPPPPAPYQRGKFNPTCLGERVLAQEMGGAVIYIGCDTGGQGCGVTLQEGFLHSLATSERGLAGDHWAEAVRFYYEHEHLAELTPNDDWYPPSIFFQAMKYVFFGDPSLPLVP